MLTSHTHDKPNFGPHHIGQYVGIWSRTDNFFLLIAVRMSNAIPSVMSSTGTSCLCLLSSKSSIMTPLLSRVDILIFLNCSDYENILTKIMENMYHILLKNAKNINYATSTIYPSVYDLSNYWRTSIHSATLSITCSSWNTVSPSGPYSIWL